MKNRLIDKLDPNDAIEQLIPSQPDLHTHVLLEEQSPLIQFEESHKALRNKH